VCWRFGAAAKRTPPKTSRTKSPTHNELRARGQMW